MLLFLTCTDCYQLCTRKQSDKFGRSENKRLLVSYLLTSSIHIPLRYEALDRLFTFAVVHVANVDFVFSWLRI